MSTTLGGADNWSNAGNWSNGTPTAGNPVIFDIGTLAFASNVDVSLTYNSVSFTTLLSDITVSTSNGSTIGIALNDTVSFADTNNVEIDVPIIGAGGLTMSNLLQTGTVTLGAFNSYSGPTTVRYGTLTDANAGDFSSNSPLEVGGNGLGTPGVVWVQHDEAVKGLFDAAGGPGSVVIAGGAALEVTASSSFSGVISGVGGGLTVLDFSTLTLTGANTYTGDTTIAAGSALKLGIGGSLGSSSIIQGGGDLYFDGTSPLTVGNLLKGGVEVRKDAAGTTTLSNGGNVYTGNTVVTDGTLADGAAGAFSPNSSFFVGLGATLQVNNAETIAALEDTGGPVGSVSIGGSNTLTIDLPSSANVTFSGNISGSSAILKVTSTDGTGVETLSGANTYGGGTIVDNATLQLSHGSISHSGAELDVGYFAGNSGALNLSGGSSVSDSTAVLAGGNLSTAAVLLTSPSDLWTSTGLVTIGQAGNATVTVDDGSVFDATAVLGAGAGSVGTFEIFNGDWNTTGSLTVGSAGVGQVVLGGGTITVGSGTGTLTLGAGSGAADSAFLAIGGATDLSVTARTAGILNAAIVNGTGAAGVDVVDFDTTAPSTAPYYFTTTGDVGGTPIKITGTTQVHVTAGANVLNSTLSTFSGGTFVDNGELMVGASSLGGVPNAPTSGPLGTGTVSFNNGSEFSIVDQNVSLANRVDLALTGQIDIEDGGNHDLALHGTVTGVGGFDSCTTGTLMLLNGSNDFGGGIDMRSGTLYVGATGATGTGRITFESGSALAGPASTVALGNEISLDGTTSISGNTGGLLELTGDISGGALLQMDSPVELSGDNSYTGGTSVTNTTLAVDSDDGIGTGLLNASHSTVSFTTPLPVIGSAFLTSSILDFTVVGGSPSLNGLSMTDTTLNFANDSTPMIIGLSSDPSVSTNSIVLGTTPGNTTVLTFDTGAVASYNGTISGEGGIDIGGAGTDTVLLLNNSNPYAGNTTVESSNMVIAGHTGALGTGTLTLNGPVSVLGVSSGATVTNTILTPNNDVYITGYGTIQPTTTQTITLQGSSVLAGGSGSVWSFFNAAPTTSIGTLSFGSNANVALSTNGTASFVQISIMDAAGAAGTGYSTINIAGTLTLGAGTVFVEPLGVNASGQYTGTAAVFNPNQSYSWTLLTAGTIVGNTSNFSVDLTPSFANSLAGGAFSIAEVGNTIDLNFTPVPEPSTWALMTGGLGLVIIGVLRRRKTQTAVSEAL